MKTPILLVLCGMVAAKIPLNFDHTECAPRNCEEWACNAGDAQAGDWCKCWKDARDYPLCEDGGDDSCTCADDSDVVMTTKEFSIYRTALASVATPTKAPTTKAPTTKAPTTFFDWTCSASSSDASYVETIEGSGATARRLLTTNGCPNHEVRLCWCSICLFVSAYVPPTSGRRQEFPLLIPS